MVVLGEHRRDSAIHIHVSILPQTPLPSRLSYNFQQSSMCYPVGSETSYSFYFLKTTSLFIWLCRVFIVAYEIPTASQGIFACGTQTLGVAHGLQGVRAQSAVVVRGLSWSRACGILVAPRGIEPASTALHSACLTTGALGKSQVTAFKLNSLPFFFCLCHTAYGILVL